MDSAQNGYETVLESHEEDNDHKDEETLPLMNYHEYQTVGPTPDGGESGNNIKDNTMDIEVFPRFHSFGQGAQSVVVDLSRFVRKVTPMSELQNLKYLPLVRPPSLVIYSPEIIGDKLIYYNIKAIETDKTKEEWFTTVIDELQALHDMDLSYNDLFLDNIVDGHLIDAGLVYKIGDQLPKIRWELKRVNPDGTSLIHNDLWCLKKLLLEVLDTSRFEGCKSLAEIRKVMNPVSLHLVLTIALAVLVALSIALSLWVEFKHKDIITGDNTLLLLMWFQVGVFTCVLLACYAQFMIVWIGGGQFRDRINKMRAREYKRSRFC